MHSRTFNYLRWAALIAFCIVIFVFSSFRADESTSQSNRIVDAIIEFVFTDFEHKPLPEQAAVTSLLTVLVRKGAHFSEYALLASLAFMAFYGIKSSFLRWFSAVGFAFLYACSDEFHQTFVLGRSGMIRDVIVDTSGAVFGALIACFIAVFLTARSIIKNYKNM